jgi:hypothetical protein
MPTNNQNWMKPLKEKPWKPTGPTLKGIVGGIGQGINNAIGGYGNSLNEVGGIANSAIGGYGQSLNELASGAKSAYNKGAQGFNAVSKATGNATLPAREAALEAAWQMVQQGNYFFGLPYSTGSYKDAISTYSQKHEGGLPPGLHTQGVDPATVLPFLSNLPPDPLQRVPGAQPAPTLPAPTQPTQAAVNQQWMRYWNNQGPRPAPGTVYKP